MSEMNQPQGGAERLLARYPEVWQAYAGLGKAAAEAGPLSARERRLVKLALAVGAGSEGAVHSHARRAGDDGVSPDDARQVCIQAITTLGFPAAMAALSWVADVTDED